MNTIQPNFDLGLLEDSLAESPIGHTKSFEWHATSIGIAALRKEAYSMSAENLNKNAINEGLEIGLDLTKEEKELHYSSKGLVIIFYS